MTNISTQDLRIGNIIDFNGRPFIVNEIYAGSIQGVNIFDKSDSGTVSEEDIQGIKFTEALLNKFGWHRSAGNVFKLSASKTPITHIENHLNIEFPYDNEGVRVWMQLKDGYGSAIYLKYLHELQNLYRALHFKELIMD
jgi:hypothetical protein